MIEESKVKFDLAKGKLIQDIINSDLSEYDKLSMIDKYNLYDVKGCIDDPFYEEHENYLKILNGTSSIIDDFFSDHDISRHSIVKPYQYLDYIDDEDYEYDENGDNMITIYTNRHNNIVYKITIDRFKELVIKWHHDNKAIGFQWDW
jgi:hypothetical protein